MDLNQLMSAMGPIQDTLNQAQQDRAQETITGSGGGGAVKIALSGDLQVKVTVAPAAAAFGDDPSMLEDVIQAALADALKQYADRFGSTPEEQLQKSLAGSPLGSMLGPLMGGLGR